jgi:hypothetical protein
MKYVGYLIYGAAAGIVGFLVESGHYGIAAAVFTGVLLFAISEIGKP